MKTAAKISVLLNLLLLGWLSWPLVRSRETKPAGTPPPSAVALDTPKVAEATTVPAMVPKVASVRTQPFLWNQLYGNDYHAYVANLRASGCPAPTLRAIVVADVHQVIQQREQELEKALSALATNSWSGQLAGWNTNAAVRAEILNLPEEEAAMLADYLGEPRALSVAAIPPQNTLTDAQAEGNPARQSVPIMPPLIAQPVDLAALNLDRGQLQAVKDLQKDFLEKIGGSGQDPSDPAYQARWRAAQAETDNMLRGMIGRRAYQDYQLSAFAHTQASPDANASASPATQESN